MIDTLVHAYTPLLLWTGLGILTFRFLPQTFPRLLGRSLYWVGVPWQIFALARQTDFSHQVGLAPTITLATLAMGFLLAWSTLQGTRILTQRSAVWIPTAIAKADSPPSISGPLGKCLLSWLPSLDRPTQGTFVIASMLGNTGFVGLGIIPALLTDGDMSWAVFFSVTQNLVGTYGVGVLIASYYGRSSPNQLPASAFGWTQLRDLLTVPILWAFALSYSTKSLVFPSWLDTIVDSSLLFVIPTSFLLMGMRLTQLQGLKSLKAALIPVVLKVIVLPSFVGLATTLLGLDGDARLSLVLMAGMPSAFASLVLAEEYDLDRDLAASSIALSTLGLLLVIPVWLQVFK